MDSVNAETGIYTDDGPKDERDLSSYRHSELEGQQEKAINRALT
jgi:hypothetical protein